LNTNLSTAEVCDGTDNDCDGEVDETSLDKGDRCNLGTGQCNTAGTYECVGDGTSNTRCVVRDMGNCYTTITSADCPFNEPALNTNLSTAEVCDGTDNDCDGEVDEDIADCSPDIEPCQNNGTFIDEGDGSYSCDCTGTGAEGEYCEIPLYTDDCAWIPCENGGICYDLGVQTYECDCTGTGYTGSNCHIPE
jgi:hypothetical protein